MEMKKLVLFLVAFLSLCACNRMRVKHDHSKHMQSVRVPVDTAQKNYVVEEKDNSWEDEDLIAIPEEPVGNKSSGNAANEVERFMRGETVE
jgi:hypothetical protein